MFSFLWSFVLLEKQRLSGYFGEPVVKRRLQKFSVRGSGMIERMVSKEQETPALLPVTCMPGPPRARST